MYRGLLGWDFSLDQSDSLYKISVEVLKASANFHNDFGWRHRLHIPAFHGAVSKLHSVVSGRSEFVAYTSSGHVVGGDLQRVIACCEPFLGEVFSDSTTLELIRSEAGDTSLLRWDVKSATVGHEFGVKGKNYRPPHVNSTAIRVLRLPGGLVSVFGVIARQRNSGP